MWFLLKYHSISWLNILIIWHNFFGSPQMEYGPLVKYTGKFALLNLFWLYLIYSLQYSWSSNQFICHYNREVDHLPLVCELDHFDDMDSNICHVWNMDLLYLSWYNRLQRWYKPAFSLIRLRDGYTSSTYRWLSQYGV